MSDTTVTSERKGFLGRIERVGNRLPDPVFLFFYLIVALVAVSVLCVMAGVSAVHPTQVAADGSAVVIRTASQLSPENLKRLLVDMPKTFTAFHPLGYVLVVFGITQSAVKGNGIESGWVVNIAGNTYFIIALLVIYLPVIWWG